MACRRGAVGGSVRLPARGREHRPILGTAGPSVADSAFSRPPGWKGGLMRVVCLDSDGLRVADVEPPVPGDGEVLVRVHAAALTRDELEWPADRLPAVPSYELSGVVVETGEEVFALTPFD